MKELEGVKRRWGQRLLSTGRIAGSAARLAARRVVGMAEGERDGELGEALSQELDQMKGMAMKVGQILSYFDGILPEQTHQALQSLQRGVTPVAYEKLREVLEESLGGKVEELFDEFDPAPIAAASIGQVYRARWQGQPVAVKIQYPQIWETIRSDFSVLDKLSRLASVATSVDGPAVVEEVRSRFREECDYLLEAAHQRAFAEAFSQRADIAIPEVIGPRSSERVLTSQWKEGRDFYAFCEAASPERRRAVGHLLASFAYHSFFGLGALNADPHPGNYIFPDEGPVVFLDFGCVRYFEAPFIEAERRLAQVVLDGQRHRFRDALMDTGMVAKEKKFDFDHHWEMLRFQYAPYFEGSFRFTPAYIKKGMEYSQPSNPNLRYLSFPPQWIWLQRLQWGLHAVLVKLQFEGSLGALYREALALPLSPLRRPEGS